MTKREEIIWNRIYWLIFNILMPLIPMAVRWIIVLSSLTLRKELKVIDVPELIYYTIFMCVISISMMHERDTSLERAALIILMSIFTVNILFVVIYYYKDTNYIVFWLSVLFSIATTIFTVLYRFRIYEEEVQ